MLLHFFKLLSQWFISKCFVQGQRSSLASCKAPYGIPSQNSNLCFDKMKQTGCLPGTWKKAVIKLKQRNDGLLREEQAHTSFCISYLEIKPAFVLPGSPNLLDISCKVSTSSSCGAWMTITVDPSILSKHPIFPWRLSFSFKKKDDRMALRRKNIHQQTRN